MTEGTRETLKGYYEGLSPEERRERIILRPEFRDSYNELVHAHRQFPVPEYLWKRWLPVIGPLPIVLYLQLRRYCYYNPGTGEKRDTCWPKQAKLAEEVGIKDRKTLRKALLVLEEQGFIARESVYYKDARSGRPHQGTDKYRVFFELPLRPEDAAELLLRRTDTADGKDFRPYGRNFSPHSAASADPKPYEGKFSPHGGGEKTDSNVITESITKNVCNVEMGKGGQRPLHVAVEALALEIGESLSTWAGERRTGAHPSEGFHRRIAARMPGRLLREALAATRDAVERRRSGKGGCRGGPAAYFAGVVKNLAAEHQVDLGLRSGEAKRAAWSIKATGRSMADRSTGDEAQCIGPASMSAQEAKQAVRGLVERIQVKRTVRHGRDPMG